MSYAVLSPFQRIMSPPRPSLCVVPSDTQPAFLLVSFEVSYKCRQSKAAKSDMFPLVKFHVDLRIV
eukprot:6205001-Pleurochrysis_carterae.AAC.1